MTTIINSILGDSRVQMNQEKPGSFSGRAVRDFASKATGLKPTEYTAINVLVRSVFAILAIAPYIILTSAAIVADVLRITAGGISNGLKRVYTALSRTPEKEQTISDRVVEVLKSKKAIDALSLTALALITYVGYTNKEAIFKAFSSTKVDGFTSQPLPQVGSSEPENTTGAFVVGAFVGVGGNYIYKGWRAKAEAPKQISASEVAAAQEEELDDTILFDASKAKIAVHSPKVSASEVARIDCYQEEELDDTILFDASKAKIAVHSPKVSASEAARIDCYDALKATYAARTVVSEAQKSDDPDTKATADAAVAIVNNDVNLANLAVAIVNNDAKALDELSSQLSEYSKATGALSYNHAVHVITFFAKVVRSSYTGIDYRSDIDNIRAFTRTACEIAIAAKNDLDNTATSIIAAHNINAATLAMVVNCAINGSGSLAKYASSLSKSALTREARAAACALNAAARALAARGR